MSSFFICGSACLRALAHHMIHGRLFEQRRVKIDRFFRFAGLLAHEHQERGDFLPAAGQVQFLLKPAKQNGCSEPLEPL
jgi:hypothetical protein